MNSEQCKLCVNSSLNIDARLLWKAAICSNCTQEVDNKIIKTSMPWMFHLCYILEFIIYGFYNGPLPEKQFVRKCHQCTFHIAFQLGYKLYAVDKLSFKEILADVSLIADQLSINEIHKWFVFQRFTVIHIAGRDHEIQEFSTFIAYKMQFESEEPTHGAFSLLRYSLERLMNKESLVPAYP